MDTSIILVPFERIANRIFLIRGKKVMFDRDLAELYQVTTKRLNEQVKRNLRRFPSDFMFQITETEKAGVVATCDHLSVLRFSHQLPYVFTEQGVAMLSSVLKSQKAIEVNIQIIRTFTKLREIVLENKELAKRLDELEQKYGKNIADIFSLLRRLVAEKKKPKGPMGFSRNVI